MKYIHVFSSISSTTKEPDYDLSNLNITNNGLISLIYGLKQKNFGFDTAKKIALKIRNYIQINPVKFDLYIDSGGYSIITGDVPFDKTKLFIESYHQYLEHHHQDFNYIFSLDIPVWGEQDEHNTFSNLYDFNKISLSYSRDIISKYKESLTNKFIFVWQFKIIDQYEVWNRIYEELAINNWIKNRAIGGLVGIRGNDKKTNIHFSPFIPIAYRCLNDHLGSPFLNDIFKLHFLGINLYQDRFAIVLLEKMFKFYLKAESLVDFTYDSANYLISGLYNSRNIQVYRFENEKLVLYKHIKDIPDTIINKVYFNDDLKNGFLSSKKLLSESERLDDTAVFISLNIYSNIMIDNYFSYLIQKYDFVNIITSTDFKPTAIKKANNAFYELIQNEAKIFSGSFIKEIINDIDMIFDLNILCFNSDRKDMLDGFIRKVITEKIKYPFRFK